ncbi:MAG: alkaline phosphatase family protein [Nitrososphaerota archaeon]|nr:alkaline phosphatase family protein [Nitrososphaerota archaeon]MDG6978654.1 alkaline phosphatase family protein [Nitrososphaerota archaeon]
MRPLALIPICLLLILAPAPHLALPPAAGTGSPIKHVVVIVQENHTFDNYFGTFPGANGIQNDPPGVHPYHLVNSTVNLCHLTGCALEDYAGGKMDGFVRGEGGNQTFGYYDRSDIPYYWSLAENYTLFDDYFTSDMGPSLPNHLYLVSAQNAGVADSTYNQQGDLDVGSIANELAAAHDSWAYYSPYTVGGENALGLVTSVADNATMMADIKPTDAFLSDLRNGSMPDVAYLTAPDSENEHPPFSIQAGMAWVQGVVEAIQSSPYWGSTVVLITWDDYGGWYDHVAPPQLDRHGDGFRVPLIMVSPFARHGYVDHALSDHTSIMKFIEMVFGLPPVTQRDAGASDLFEALDSAYYAQAPRPAGDALCIQGTPSPLFLPGGGPDGEFNPSLAVGYLNVLDHAQPAVLTAMLRNPLNQTIQVASFSALAPAGAVVDAPFYFNEVPDGNYSVSVVALAPDGAAASRPLLLMVEDSTL